MAVARWSSRLSIRSSQARRSSRLRGSKDPGVQLEPVETLQRLDPAKPWAAWFGHQTGGQQPGHAVIPHPAMAATGRMRQGAEPEGFSDLRGPGHQDRWL